MCCWNKNIAGLQVRRLHSMGGFETRRLTRGWKRDTRNNKMKIGCDKVTFSEAFDGCSVTFLDSGI